MALRRRNGEVDLHSRVLEVDASMTGTLNFKDPVNLQINGTFEGTLNTKGLLTIGEKARVNATIHGDQIVIGGTVDGTVIATERLELGSTARVTGKITSPKLTVHQGAILQGTCEMMPEPAATQWMTVVELARYLEVDQQTIMDWVQGGRLPAQQEGTEWRFNRQRVEEWLAQEKIK